MNQPPQSPYQVAPPSARRLLGSVAAAVGAALLILALVVLPAEYGIDPTGMGDALGLTSLSAQPGRTLEVRDVIGGNESYREIEIPDAGEPIPLPNPAVAQIRDAPPRTQEVELTLQPGQRTEIKAVLSAAQVIVYSWRAEGGEVYTDFHGHEPDGDPDAFVRYEEQQSGNAGNGSLVAPFAGEHGWFWLNISEQPVTIHLTFTGYFDDYVDYGLFSD